MKLENYNNTRGNQLERLNLLPIQDPFKITPLWIRCISHELNKQKLSTKAHVHSFYEAHYVFSGSIKYNDLENRKTYTIKNGNGILFSPNSPHNIASFSNDLIKISITFSISNDNANECFQEIASKSVHLLKISETVSCDFDDILFESDKKNIFSPYLIRDRIFSIICSILRQANVHEELKIETKKEDIRISSAIQYINDNKCSALTCEDVAQYCKFNTKYLSRLFKQNTGITLLDYIHKTKNEEAKRLLMKSNFSLEEISSLTGFSNVYYFNTFFKKINGVPPGEYRKLSQSNSKE